MSKTHYYVLIRKIDEDSSDVLGFFLTREEAETARAGSDFPQHVLEIIETDSKLKKI